VHITVACPRCLREYHLDDSLRGQTIRCPNALCREIIEVRPEISQPAPPPRGNQEIIPDQAGLQPLPGEQATPPRTDPTAGGSAVTGSVGDLVPILPAAAEEEDPPMAHEVELEPAEPSSSRVGEMVTLLPAEPAYTLEPPAPKEPPSWQQPPPVRAPSPNKPDKPRGRQAPEPAGPPDRPKKAADTVQVIPGTPFEVYSAPAPPEAADNGQQTAAGGPVELPPGAWEAPPVRRPDDEALPEAPPYPAGEGDVHTPVLAAEHHDEDLEHVIPTRRWGRRVLIAMLGLAVAASVAVLLVYLGIFKASEETRYDDARKEYAAGRFGDAGKHFRELALDEKLAESPRKEEYEFFADLSEVRDAIEGLSPDVEKGPGQLHAFLQSHAGAPLLKENRGDVWKSCQRLVEEFTARAREPLSKAPPDFRGAKDSLNKARQWRATAKQYLATGVPSKADDELAANIDQVQQAIAHAEHRANVRARVVALNPTASELERARRIIGEAGFEKDPEFKDLLAQLATQVQERVTYVRAKRPHLTSLPPEEPSLVVAEAASPGFRIEGVVFALARGLLHALDQRTGTPLWYTRVGIDTFTLPVRLPLDPLGRENVLVLSSDTNTLTSRDARTGEARWSHDLGKQPSLGRPVVVGQLAYVPTYDGTVHEIELAQGRLVGQFKLGLPLSTGGVYQPGTNLVYFPADSQAVYVLDVAAHTCVAILPAEHSAGSLRGEPIIISRDAVRREFGKNMDEAPDYLVLNQTDGLSAMKLRVFKLSARPKDSVEEPRDSEPRIPGWSQFAPYHDAEKLIQFTDAGQLAYIGINQLGNQDKPLFVQSINDLAREGKERGAGASQVVHASEDDIWVLAHGDLQLRHYHKFGQSFPSLWQEPLPLGSPLHASQVDATGDRLFLVTQSLTQQHCLATAVKAETGEVLWQRQLGLVCQGQPLVVDGSVLVLDQGGALYLFDPRQPPRPLNGPWQVGGRLLAEALPQGAIASSLRPGPDGSAYQITTVDQGEQHGVDRYELVVRRYQPGKELFQKTFRRWPSPLHGTPGVESNSILLPLENGHLRRQELDKNEDQGANGPDWRAPRADAGARRHVVVLSDGEFIMTDGSNGLARWHWPVGDDQLVKLKKRGELFLPARIVTAPLLLPPTKDHPGPRTLVADADGNVTLVEGDKLEVKRQWNLKGRITAGPYLLGQWSACVVDGRRLVLIDPEKEGRREYRTPGEGIVGRPQLVGDLVVVADQQGAFVGLDPATGEPRRKSGYTLRANVAPAASPVAFGPDLLFAPLTDGTVLLLPRKDLWPPAK
jgi:outer membrane protein assembly factor BamB